MSISHVNGSKIKRTPAMDMSLCVPQCVLFSQIAITEWISPVEISDDFDAKQGTHRRSRYGNCRLRAAALRMMGKDVWAVSPLEHGPIFIPALTFIHLWRISVCFSSPAGLETEGEVGGRECALWWEEIEGTPMTLSARKPPFWQQDQVVRKGPPPLLLPLPPCWDNFKDQCNQVCEKAGKL